MSADTRSADSRRADSRRADTRSADARSADTRSADARSADTRSADTRRADARTADTRRDLGAAGEQLAAEHLERRGYRIIARNYRTRFGELDIVAFDGRTLAFCEVKTRRLGRRPAMPLEAIRPRKALRVRHMARSWLDDHPGRPHAELLRFDAIGVTVDRAGRLVSLEHLEAAF